MRGVAFALHDRDAVTVRVLENRFSGGIRDGIAQLVQVDLANIDFFASAARDVFEQPGEVVVAGVMGVGVKSGFGADAPCIRPSARRLR